MGIKDGVLTLTVAGLEALEWGLKEEEVDDMGLAEAATIRDKDSRFSMNSSLTAPI